MSLPGVRTVLKDRFFTLARTDVPEGTRVVGIARRSEDPYTITDTFTEEDLLIDLTDAEDGNYYLVDNMVYQWDDSATSFVEVGFQKAPDLRPFVPRSEEYVIRNFGEGSELHRCYLELVQGGAARVTLIPAPSIWLDIDLEDQDNIDVLFENAEVVRPDIIVPWGRGGNTDNAAPVGFNSRKLVLTKVAAKCREITDRSNPCFAILGVPPADGTQPLSGSEASARYDALSTDIMERGVGLTPVEDLQYISLVATELRPTAYVESFGWANGAATYAGLCSILNSESAPTGKRLYDVDELRYVPTRSQQESVIALGAVPISLSSRNNATVVDGQTFAHPTSDYTRLSTLRIVFDAVQLIRRTAEPYVGQPATLEHRNAMETAITSALRGMQMTGALVASDFNIAYISREYKAQIDLVLIPAFEMRNIEVSVTVQL